MASKKVLIMPTPEERELAERLAKVNAAAETSAPETVPLQALLDLERAVGRLESAVEGLERSTAKNTHDLNGLGKTAHAASLLGKIALGVMVPVAFTITLAVLHSIYQAIEKLMSLK